MCTMGATIGTGDEDFFKHRTLEVRNSHVKRINEFMISLPFSLSEKICHSRKPQFKVENGLYQLIKEMGIEIHRFMFHIMMVLKKDQLELIF